MGASTGWNFDPAEAPAAGEPPPLALEPGCRPGQYVALVGPGPENGMCVAAIYDGDSGFLLKGTLRYWSESRAQRWCDIQIRKFRARRRSLQ